MPLEHLLAALEKEATAEADALLAAARADADRITRETDAALARRRADALRARETALRGAAAAALGEARRAGRAAVLEARQRLLERVFAAARAGFAAALADGGYRAALPTHLAEAAAALGDEPAVIHCPHTIAAAVRAAAPSQDHLTVQPDATAAPGIAITTTDGVIEVDNTLEARLERLRPELQVELLARLGART